MSCEGFWAKSRGKRDKPVESRVRSHRIVTPTKVNSKMYVTYLSVERTEVTNEELFLKLLDVPKDLMIKLKEETPGLSVV